MPRKGKRGAVPFLVATALCWIIGMSERWCTHACCGNASYAMNLGSSVALHEFHIVLLAGVKPFLLTRQLRTPRLSVESELSSSDNPLSDDASKPEVTESSDMPSLGRLWKQLRSSGDSDCRYVSQSCSSSSVTAWLGHNIRQSQGSSWKPGNAKCTNWWRVSRSPWRKACSQAASLRSLTTSGPSANKVLKSTVPRRAWRQHGCLGHLQRGRSKRQPVSQALPPSRRRACSQQSLAICRTIFARSVFHRWSLQSCVGPFWLSSSPRPAQSCDAKPRRKFLSTHQSVPACPVAKNSKAGRSPLVRRRGLRIPCGAQASRKKHLAFGLSTVDMAAMAAGGDVERNVASMLQYQ